MFKSTLILITFLPQLAKIYDHENNNWDEFLSPVVFAYDTSIHSTTQHSPFQLQFGREPRLHLDKPSFNYVFYRPIDYYSQLKKSVQIIHEIPRNNIVFKQLIYKNRNDSHYKINDPVLIKSRGMKAKLEPKYSITRKIIVRKQHPIYWVKDEQTQIESRVHVNDIRPILILKQDEI